jgi:hypothetical protein
VRSIYDAHRTFRIDRSISPERLFHEEGSDRWYTRNELLAIKEANISVIGLDANIERERTIMRSLAFRGLSGRQLTGAQPAKQPETRRCRECEIAFTPKHKRQKFCCGPHRTAYWKRQYRSYVEGEGAQTLATTA